MFRLRKKNDLALGGILFLIYWLAKPFYLFPSGEMQIGDIIMCIAVVITVLMSLKIEIKKVDIKFIVFCVFVAFINVGYYTWFDDTEFIKAILFFVFNMMGILLFRYWGKSNTFLRAVRICSFINIIVQVIILFSGHGRLYGSLRYKGTFNDPNQFAFFVFCMFLFVYLITVYMKDKRFIKDILFISSFFISLYLIIISGSAGNLLGILVFSAMLLFQVSKDYRNKVFLFLGTLIFSLIVALMFIQWDELMHNMYRFFGNKNIISRIIQKIAYFLNGEGVGIFLTDRNLDIIVKYPEYCLWGAGDGIWERFPIGGYVNGGEIHSTFPALLFSYGVVPFFVICSWIRSNLKKSNTYSYIAIIALVVESMTLVNHRQTIFWLIFVMASLCKKYVRDTETNCESTY